MAAEQLNLFDQLLQDLSGPEFGWPGTAPDTLPDEDLFEFLEERQRSAPRGGPSKYGPDILGPPARDLSNMSYGDLQKLAKEAGIRANQKKVKLIAELEALEPKSSFIMRGPRTAPPNPAPTPPNPAPTSWGPRSTNWGPLSTGTSVSGIPGTPGEVPSPASTRGYWGPHSSPRRGRMQANMARPLGALEEIPSGRLGGSGGPPGGPPAGVVGETPRELPKPKKSMGVVGKTFNRLMWVLMLYEFGKMGGLFGANRERNLEMMGTARAGLSPMSQVVGQASQRHRLERETEQMEGFEDLSSGLRRGREASSYAVGRDLDNLLGGKAGLLAKVSAPRDNQELQLSQLMQMGLL